MKQFVTCTREYGGVVLEYLIVSVFSGALAVVALNYISGHFRTKMEELGLSTDGLGLPEIGAHRIHDDP